MKAQKQISKAFLIAAVALLIAAFAFASPCGGQYYNSPYNNDVYYSNQYLPFSTISNDELIRNYYGDNYGYNSYNGYYNYGNGYSAYPSMSYYGSAYPNCGYYCGNYPGYYNNRYSGQYETVIVTNPDPIEFRGYETDDGWNQYPSPQGSYW